MKQSLISVLSGFVARGIRHRVPPPDGTEKMMIILGARMIGMHPSNSLRFRLERALEYAAEHPELLIITSGGQGKNEIIPEGEGMKQYLVSRGLEPERILTENRSTSTRENFAFSLQVMKAAGFDETTPVVYVTNDYHCFRAGQYAEMEGYRHVRGLPAETPAASVPENYVREGLSMLKLAGTKFSRRIISRTDRRKAVKEREK